MNVLERFESVFRRDPTPLSLVDASVAAAGSKGVLGDQYAGTSFGGGMYRIASDALAIDLDAIIGRMWPSFLGTIRSFAFDWRGRIFAARKGTRGYGDIVLFEPGSGDNYEIPLGVTEFHNQELVDYTEEALSESLFRDWVAAHGSGPTFSRCIGYRVPLFLDGQEGIANLEECELEVYLEICAQLWVKTKKLPEGSRIGSVKIK